MRPWMLAELHALPVLAWPLPVSVAWLLAAATPAEVATAASLHQAQREQLADPSTTRALADAYRALETTWLRYGPRLLGPAAELDALLRLAPREVADQVAADLQRAGFGVPWPPQ